jgi:hypothetical protein
MTHYTPWRHRGPEPDVPLLSLPSFLWILGPASSEHFCTLSSVQNGSSSPYDRGTQAVRDPLHNIQPHKIPKAVPQPLFPFHLSMKCRPHCQIPHFTSYKGLSETRYTLFYTIKRIILVSLKNGLHLVRRNRAYRFSFENFTVPWNFYHFTSAICTWSMVDYLLTERRTIHWFTEPRPRKYDILHPNEEQQISDRKIRAGFRSKLAAIDPLASKMTNKHSTLVEFPWDDQNRTIPIEPVENTNPSIQIQFSYKYTPNLFVKDTHYIANRISSRILSKNSNQTKIDQEPGTGRNWAPVRSIKHFSSKTEAQIVFTNHSWEVSTRFEVSNQAEKQQIKNSIFTAQNCKSSQGSSVEACFCKYLWRSSITKVNRSSRNSWDS